MRCFILLLLAASSWADEAQIAQIRQRGAELVLQLVTEDAAIVLRLHENGKAPLAEVQRSERRRLDAELALLDAKMLNAEATKVLVDKRLDILGKIEQLEAKRLAAARKLAAAGAGTVGKREIAHQLAWIERDYALQMKAKPAKARWLTAHRERQRAKVFANAAQKTLARLEALHKAGAATAKQVLEAKVQVARTETELAIAKERVRMAEK
ncbi:MAG: TolC family protein [Planctomycetota bacterium]|jgi:hypothetical protein